MLLSPARFETAAGFCQRFESALESKAADVVGELDDTLTGVWLRSMIVTGYHIEVEAVVEGIWRVTDFPDGQDDDIASLAAECRSGQGLVPHPHRRYEVIASSDVNRLLLEIILDKGSVGGTDKSWLGDIEMPILRLMRCMIVPLNFDVLAGGHLRSWPVDVVIIHSIHLRTGYTSTAYHVSDIPFERSSGESLDAPRLILDRATLVADGLILMIVAPTLARGGVDDVTVCVDGAQS